MKPVHYGYGCLVLFAADPKKWRQKLMGLVILASSGNHSLDFADVVGVYTGNLILFNIESISRQ